MERVTLACGHTYVTNTGNEELLCLVCDEVYAVKQRESVTLGREQS